MASTESIVITIAMMPATFSNCLFPIAAIAASALPSACSRVIGCPHAPAVSTQGALYGTTAFGGSHIDKAAARGGVHI